MRWDDLAWFGGLKYIFPISPFVELRYFSLETLVLVLLSHMLKALRGTSTSVSRLKYRGSTKGDFGKVDFRPPNRAKSSYLVTYVNFVNWTEVQFGQYAVHMAAFQSHHFTKKKKPSLL